MQNDEYVSRFSHELRNPLTLIYSSLQLLEKECPSVCASVLWEQIKKDMCDVIQLLKDMSAPYGTSQMAPLRLADLFSELSSSFTPSMKLQGIHFVTELPNELSDTVITADRKQLRRAVTNLIVNAADAVSAQIHTDFDISAQIHADRLASKQALSGPDSDSSFGTESAPDRHGIPGRISLSAVTDGRNVCVHVRDNGPGIPQEYLASLFDPFVTHKPNGTGLGLGIAKKIAEQHRGSLTVDTCCNPCSGSATYTDFCLQLPVRKHNSSASTNPAMTPPMCAQLSTPPAVKP